MSNKHYSVKATFISFGQLVQSVAFCVKYFSACGQFLPVVAAVAVYELPALISHGVQIVVDAAFLCEFMFAVVVPTSRCSIVPHA